MRDIPPLTEEETQRLAELKAEAARRLEPTAEDAHKKWAHNFAARRGLSQQDAERIATQATKHVLEGDFELEFDDPDIGICTVAELLDKSEDFVGATLADPHEGVGYGRGKAKVLRQSDGRLLIHSFAHGGAKYQMAGQGVGLRDFFAYMEKHCYLYAPTREAWPAVSVNARIAPIALLGADGQPILDDRGKQKTIPASAWLDQHQPVEQITWAPGEPMLIRNRLISEGGWITRNAVACFNLYRPPDIKPGNADQAGPWIKHIRKVYPDNADHIIKYLAHRVQRPPDKINHALVLGGGQGIGKDTILEPVRHAIGPWNFKEATPSQVMGRFNSFLKAVLLRVSEAHDLGEFDRFTLYEHMKSINAAPPPTHRVDEKNLREHYVININGTVITTNHRTDGIYPPADDRRHYVAWSELAKEDFPKGYFDKIWKWYERRQWSCRGLSCPA